jgi:hypothetical protein
MYAAIALKLYTWLYMYDLQIKFEDGCYRPIFRRVMPIKRFYNFPDFFLSAYKYSFDTLLCHTKIQSKIEFGSDLLIFHEVMALELRKKSRIISFPHFFSSPELKAQVSYSDHPLSVVRLSVCKLLHFRLLLQNHWANFNQTWHKSSLGGGDSKLFK